MSKKRTSVRIYKPAKSKVSVRGQTVIPQVIRERLGITPKTELDWSIHEGVMFVVPIPDDPVAASVGLFKKWGYDEEQYAKDRERDLELERAHEERLMNQVAEQPAPKTGRKSERSRGRAVAP